MCAVVDKFITLEMGWERINSTSKYEPLQKPY